MVKIEEKGSDVNLASLLLADGFRGKYEAAVVLSNDSDLMLPIHIVTRELGLPVGLLNPVGCTNSITPRSRTREVLLREGRAAGGLTVEASLQAEGRFAWRCPAVAGRVLGADDAG